jgi:multiple sugar transport system permease protein
MAERLPPAPGFAGAPPRPGLAQSRTRRPTRRLSDERVFKYVMLAPAILWVAALTFFPLFEVLRYSFASYVLGRGITGYVGFRNYAEVLGSMQFWHSILITVIYVLVTVPIEVVLGFLLAWLVNLHAPGTKFFRMLLTAPLFTMEVAIGYLGITLFSAQGGLLSSMLNLFGISIPWLSTATWGLAAAMILEVWRWTPFVFLLALAALAAIPEEIYDAAVIDCDSHWQIMHHIAVPLAWPVMTVAVLFRLIEGFKAFGLPFALTSGGPGTSTQLFSIFDYLTTVQFFDFGQGSAMGIVVLIMLSVVIALFFGQMRPRLG